MSVDVGQDRDEVPIGFTMVGDVLWASDDVVIEGKFATQMPIRTAGNLLARGTLTGTDIICGGVLEVLGDLICDQLTCPFFVRVTGKSEIDTLLIGMNQTWLDEYLVSEVETRRLYRNSEPFKLKQSLRELTGPGMYTEGGIESELIIIHGNLRCGGILESPNLLVHRGQLSADSLSCEENMYVFGDAYISDTADVFGRCHVHGLKVGSNLYVGDSLNVDGAMEVRARVWIGRNLTVAERLEAGSSLMAGGHIRCGGYICVRGSIFAGETISSGPGYSIVAGLDVPKSRWNSDGTIGAKKRPQNIRSGLFMPDQRPPSIWEDCW